MTQLSAKDLWIQRPRPRPGARLRLLLLPHAGGGASAFRGWADAIAADGVEVCPVQLPGRENRLGEPPFDRLPPLVEALAGALERWHDLPYAVFGHSIGSLVGFELARRAAAAGVPGPVHLFASARRAPGLPSRQRDIHQLPDAELLADLRALGGMPQALLDHPELMALVLPVLRADLALTETYTPTPGITIGAPITAYLGEGDEKVTVDEARAWGSHTTASFRMRTFPGDHFYLFALRDQVLQALSADLRAITAAL
ncbi:MAG TPA: thioesterase domain-containing protein [Longimicrobium sp.]|nr:thioesterase domain-containing protein [Longimicrobium sp.]